jgi:hypothetical protein
MGIAVTFVGFEGAVPSFEALRDTLSERLGTPVDLIETPPGFWVGMAVSRSSTRGFSITRRERALEPVWACRSPEDELLLCVLAELGGVLELVHSPSPREVRNRFSFEGAVPTPEQVEAGLRRVTGIAPSSPPYEVPMSHELRAPMLGRRSGTVSLSVKPHGIRLRAGVGATLIWDAKAALVSLGGRELDLREVQGK